MSSVQQSPRFGEFTRLLQERAEAHGVMLTCDEAGKLLAERVTAHAGQLGVPPVMALENFLSHECVAAIARTLGSHAASYQEMAGETAPVPIGAADVGQIVAAIATVIKLGLGSPEKPQAEALTIAADGADALMGIGAAIRATGESAHVRLGGQALVWTRSVLTQAIELLRSGQWECPCPGPHRPGSACGMVRNLTSDLSLVARWPVGDHPGRGA